MNLSLGTSACILVLCLAALVIFSGTACADVNTNRGWHPMQQIALSSTDMNSLDDNSNNMVDLSENSGSCSGDAVCEASSLHVTGITQITDGVAGADTASYGTFGVTRVVSADALSYIAMTRQANVVWAMGIDSNNKWVFGPPAPVTQIIPNPYFMVIEPSGNVGIGTSSPLTRLDVNGWGSFLNQVNVGGAWAQIQSTNPDTDLEIKTGGIGDIYLNPGGNVGIGTNNPKGKLGVSFNDGDEMVVYSPGNNQLALQTALDNQPIGIYGGHANNILLLQPSVGNVAMVTGGGSVGIGTSAPEQKLHVVGEGDGIISVDSAAVSDPLIAFRIPGVIVWNAGIDNSDGDKFKISRGNSWNNIGIADFVSIDGAGNVGIGTSNPRFTLEVNGRIIQTAPYDANNLLGNYDIGTGRLGAGTSIYSYGPICAGNLAGDCVLTEGVTVSPGNTVGNPNVAISGVGNSYFNAGNVGIGTASPNAKLDVLRTAVYSFPTPGLASGTIHLSAIDPNAVTNALTFGGPAGYIGQAEAGIYSNVAFGWGSTLHFATSDDFNAGSKVRMTILPSGNVGIGTTSPDQKLKVIGNINASGNVIGTQLCIAGDCRSAWPAGGGNVTGFGNVNYVPLWTSGAYIGNSVVSQSGGNVGIGTSPTQRLTVNGEINYPSSWRLTNAWGNDVLTIKRNAWDGSSNNNYGNLAGGHAYFYDGLQSGGPGGWEAGGGQLYVAGNSMLMGNVGIGTAAPASKLDVAGAVQADNLILDPQGGDEGGQLQLQPPNPSYPNTWYIDSYAGSLRILNGGNIPLYIRSDNQVCINGVCGMSFPTSPACTLCLNGCGGSWPSWQGQFQVDDDEEKNQMIIRDAGCAGGIAQRGTIADAVALCCTYAPNDFIIFSYSYLQAGLRIKSHNTCKSSLIPKAPDGISVVPKPPPQRRVTSLGSQP